MDGEDLLFLIGAGLVGYAVFSYMSSSPASASIAPSTPAPALPPPAPTVTDQAAPPSGTSQQASPPALDPLPSTPPNTIMWQSPPAPGSTGVTSISANGEAFIKRQESWRSTPYKDGDGYSIGWGHRIKPGEHFTSISQSEGEALFQNDLTAVEQAINSSVTVALNQNQYDALADFVFNVGAPHFQSSTLLRDLNAGDYAGASAELAHWVYSQGKVVAALVTRRKAEQALFGVG